jgi:hypothetical protein
MSYDERHMAIEPSPENHFAAWFCRRCLEPCGQDMPCECCDEPAEGDHPVPVRAMDDPAPLAVRYTSGYYTAGLS